VARNAKRSHVARAEDGELRTDREKGSGGQLPSIRGRRVAGREPTFEAVVPPLTCSAAPGVSPDDENILENRSLSWWTSMGIFVVYPRLLPDFLPCD
jgi:hypothetical protein